MEKKLPLFSVLIANYNSECFISGCIESVLAQTYKNIEIIVVDDDSTDNSLKIIQSFSKKYTFIKLFTNDKNYGVGYTKKRCIDSANGDICGFLDQDDKLTPNAIEEMCIQHNQSPKASLVYSNMFFCDENLNITGVKKIAQVPLNQNDFFNQEGHISHFASFKKSAYLKTKGRNITLKRSDDQDLYFKLYDVGDAILIDKPLYYYRIHKGGQSTLGNNESAFFERWKIIFQRAEEKGIDIEEYFWQTFVRRDKVKYWLGLDSLVRRTWIFKLVKEIRR